MRVMPSFKSSAKRRAAASSSVEKAARADFSSPAALTWVEAKVFAAFPGTEKLATSVVTAAGQKAVVLTPGTTRVLLPQ